VPSAYDQLRSETPEFREVDPNATAFMQDVQGLLRQGEIAKALRRVQVGLATGSYGPAGSLGGRVLGYFSDDPETAAQRAAGREAMQWLNDPANERMLLENPDLILLAAEDPISFVARAGSGQMIADLARKDAEAVAEERAAAGITSTKDSFGARLARGDQEPGMTTGTPIYEQRIASLVPTSTETPDETGVEEQAAPTAEQRIVDLLPTPTETSDETGGDGTGTRDLRARAEDRIKLFQDLFGSDEPTARDRAMQFAMIGLAIAAGQSPNALTNIASGLLAGTQAMTAQEAERRKERRALRSSAVTSVLDEMETERKAGENPLSKFYGESTSNLETKHFGNIPQFTPTLPGVMGGLGPIVAGEQDRIITTYNTLMDESDRLLGLSAEAQSLLDTGDVAGFEGSASRFMSRAAAALPDDIASALGVDVENQRVSAAQRFDVIQRTLAAQLAPMLLGESGRTISDADRRRVAEVLGIAIEDKDGLGLNIRGLSSGAFRSEAELREAISEVQNILQRNRKEVEDEFSMLSNRIPGFSVTRPETPATTQSGPAPIVLTEEDITRYGG